MLFDEFDRINLAIVTAAVTLVMVLLILFGWHVAHENNIKARERWHDCLAKNTVVECQATLGGHDSD